MEEIESQKQQLARDEFFGRLKAEVEGLYSRQDKPSTEDKAKVIQKFKKEIEVFCKKNNIKKEKVVHFALDKLNERRKINPASKLQYDLIEESLYDILYEGQDFDEETFDL